MHSLNLQPDFPSSQDELLLPKGFQYDMVASYGDKINPSGDTFGFNPAFTAFFPMDDTENHGLLYVNHDSSSTAVHGAPANGHFSAGQIRQMLYSQGGSVVEVYRSKKGKWTLDPNSAYARRITGLERAELTGPARGTASVRTAGTVQGTLANHSGTVTLWGSVLSGEGLYDEACRDAGLNPTHYGWVVEVDPFEPKSAIKKHSALGRFRHGGMAMGLGKKGRLVVYMGDRSNHACLYKFVSKEAYQPALGKENAKLLNDGTLYAADLVNGAWIKLSTAAVQQTLKDHAYQPPAVLQRSKESLLELFREEADVYVYAYEAALILGATRTDRQEGVALHPDTGDLYVAIGQNVANGNIHGYLAHLSEKDGDAEAPAFHYDSFTAGGPQNGFSSPGSLDFEPNGNVWACSAIDADKVNKGSFAALQNNGLYVFSTASHTVNTPVQFASAPVGAHFTGTAFTPGSAPCLPLCGLRIRGTGRSLKAGMPMRGLPFRSGCHNRILSQ
ncbi:PhoX family protein [Paenibacillus sp. CC-CFT747]|nr:PhoX family protein [Paenibacillus sp. CC-CFT747]